MVFIPNRVKDIVVGLLLSVFIFVGFTVPLGSSKFISPLSGSGAVYAQGVGSSIHRRFSFAPGGSFNNILLVNTNGIDTLAFYDVPILSDGTLYKEGNGYSIFHDQVGALLQKAQSTNTKVALTVTLTDPNVMKEFLSDKDAQSKAITEIIDEVVSTNIDGVVVDFEYPGNPGAEYRNRFTQFVGAFNKQMHRKIKNTQVSVALSGSALHNSLFNLADLAKNTDNVLVMAYDFAVPEVHGTATATPRYSYASDEYWNTVGSSVEEFTQQVSLSKLELETAWYGSGDSYPLYDPKDMKKIVKPQVDNNISLPLSQATIERMMQYVSPEVRPEARKNLPIIASALKQEGILNTNVLAYALATIEHETAGTFEPIEEIQGRKSARRLGYEGGTDYFGRGFIQITHLRNYKTFGERIGMGDALVKNPSLALKADVSARILAAYFVDNGVALAASNGNFVAARRAINPDAQGWWIATLAWKFLNALS